MGSEQGSGCRWEFLGGNRARCSVHGTERVVVRPHDFGPPPEPNPEGEMARWKRAVRDGMARLNRETCS